MARSEVRKNGQETGELTALVADSAGRVFELEGYGAVGRDGQLLVPLTAENSLPMPHGSELMMLPGRAPALFNRGTGRFETLTCSPLPPGGPIFPVAVFNSPGYLLSLVSAFEERPGAGPLPLFSYGAVGWQRGGFRSALIRVDREPRQDLRQMPLSGVKAGIRRMRRLLPGNRLREHLEHCALIYGCPAGKNFFLGRYEAPLPTSSHCNAHCLGCLSLQSEESKIPCSQQRIAFTPRPAEIAAVALAHLRSVARSIVSFGQGCEGDPLLAAAAIAPAIGLIRSGTSRGTINLNTNGGLPQALETLLKAGLDSVRISLNSVRPATYQAYFRPRGFSLEEVKASIDLALRYNRFVALNYLNLPGFSDTPEEAEALCAFLKKHPVHMIQWRNLNFDPPRYLDAMAAVAPAGRPMGMAALLGHIRAAFPKLRFGYFNPPRETFPGHARIDLITEDTDALG